MTRLRTNVVNAVVAIAVGLAVPRLTPAQETAPPVDTGPPRVQAAVPDAPVQMRSNDAARLRSAAVAPSAAPAPAAPPPSSGGVSRTITLETPPVVNRSSQFEFRDRTDRPERPVLPMAVRQAAVDAYRRSIAASRARGR